MLDDWLFNEINKGILLQLSSEYSNDSIIWLHAFISEWMGGLLLESASFFSSGRSELITRIYLWPKWRREGKGGPTACSPLLAQIENQTCFLLPPFSRLRPSDGDDAAG